MTGERRGITTLDPTWPTDLDVVVVPGIVGQRDHAYPASTTNLIKLLRERGIRVGRIERAPDIKLMGAEAWLPFLLVMNQILASGAAGLIVEGIKELLATQGADRPNAVVHAKVGRVDLGASSFEWVEYEGPPDRFIELIRAFLER